MYFEQYCSIGPYGRAHTRQSFPEPLNGEQKTSWPDFSQWIPPMQLRRMSKCIRIGIAASRTCLELKDQAEFTGSIHVGTALGMLSDSEQFLKTMLERKEQMLTPTAFIQSTHNTVAGSIALSLGAHTHNMTFAQGGHSFESALFDAVLLLKEQGNTALIGATDECTPTSLAFMRHLNIHTSDPPLGEGGAFFLVSQEKTARSIAKLGAFELFKADPENPQVVEAFAQFLARHDASISAGDPLITGQLANEPYENIYAMIHRQYFEKKALITPYKKWSGDYPTASATGLALALQTLQKNPQQTTWMIANWGNCWSFWKLES